MTPDLLSEVRSSQDSSPLAKDIVRAAFAADAHCLGPHWVYDQAELSAAYPDGIQHLGAPKSAYHPGKIAGDFTHHGDQSLALLESIGRFGRWCADVWAEDFANFWKAKPNCYFDGAARGTLESAENGKTRASDSDDLAGVSRMAPLFAVAAKLSEEQQVAAARDLVGVTHGDPIVGDVAEFVVRSVLALASGKSFGEGFELAIETGCYERDLGKSLDLAKSKLGEPAAEVAAEFGQSCPTEKAFPLLLWFALSYAEKPTEMLEQNALVGGDNSARAMVLGMFIAASGQFEQLPGNWYGEVKARAKIESVLSKLLD